MSVEPQYRLRAHWVQNVLADPVVRVRIGAQRLRGRARVVDHRAERRLVRVVRGRSEATGS